MYAKSTPRMEGLSMARLAHWVRSLMTLLVLGASLVALLLIVNHQYGPLIFGESLEPAADALRLTQNAARPDGDPALLLSAAEEGRYRTLAEFLAKRYRVSPDVTFKLVSHAHTVGRQLGLDPLLIIAVIAVESGFNPIAESDKGAKGLMQVIPKYHPDKLQEFGGEKAVFDPVTNIVVGARILKEYIRLTGNLGSALQMYAGALGDTEDQYTNRVMSEKRRLQYVLSRTVPRSIPLRTASANQLPSTPLD